MKSHLKVLSVLFPVLLVIAVVAGMQAGQPTNAKQKRAPLSVLRTSERVLDDVMAKKGIALSPNGKSLYVLDHFSGGVTIYDKGNRASRRLTTFVKNAKTFVVGPQNNIYIAGEDSLLRIIDGRGQELTAFPVPDLRRRVEQR